MTPEAAAARVRDVPASCECEWRWRRDLHRWVRSMPWRGCPWHTTYGTEIEFHDGGDAP